MLTTMMMMMMKMMMMMTMIIILKQSSGELHMVAIFCGDAASSGVPAYNVFFFFRKGMQQNKQYLFDMVIIGMR